MLDNAYLYLAATRLSLFHSDEDWAIVIEVFGFSPRAGEPGTQIVTFASRLHDRNGPERYVSPEWYLRYLERNPNNESRFIHPIAVGAWQDAEDPELVAEDARGVILRGAERPTPVPHDYQRHGIQLERPPRVMTFELCRYLAATARDDVLASPVERRISVRPEMTQILQLEEWTHPDFEDPDARPSDSPTFQQLARVLATGDAAAYAPSLPANTHWRHWPEGGRG